MMQDGLLGVCEEVAGVLGLEPLDWSGLAAGELVGQAQVRDGGQGSHLVRDMHMWKHVL